METAKLRTCNRHIDCDAADQRELAKGRQRPFINFHCHNEDCEDCFGS